LPEGGGVGATGVAGVVGTGEAGRPPPLPGLTPGAGAFPRRGAAGVALGFGDFGGCFGLAIVALTAPAGGENRIR
jgi:hypothetical protein